MTLELLQEVFELCVIPLLGVLTKYLIGYLSAKKDEINTNTDSLIVQKYSNMIYTTITDCVKATNQTYVDSLKQSGSFDAAAQEEAFNRTLAAVLAILTDDAKEYISATTGDLNVYLQQLIEAEVKKQK